MALWTEWVSANETGGNNFTETAVVNLNGVPVQGRGLARALVGAVA